MGIINIIVIGLGLAMDALAVSITSGLTVRRVRIRYALKLALSFAGFQALMPVIGWLAGIRFSEDVYKRQRLHPSVAETLASLSDSGAFATKLLSPAGIPAPVTSPDAPR